jgi:hypothetical protein
MLQFLLPSIFSSRPSYRPYSSTSLSRPSAAKHQAKETLRGCKGKAARIEHEMELSSGQFHFQQNYTRGRQPPCAGWIGGFVVSRTGLRVRSKKKFQPEIEPLSSGR